MRLKHNLMVATELAHSHALHHARRAMRRGDLATAERWMKLSERHYRNAELAREEAERWGIRRREIRRTEREAWRSPRRPSAEDGDA